MSQRMSGYARVPDDVYETPSWAVTCLIPHLPKHLRSIHDPAMGTGNITDTLIAETDLIVTGNDISNGVDFLKESMWHESICMNPPYRQAEEFITHSLEVADFVAALLRVDYDSAKTRRYLFGDCSRFAKKLILTRRIIWFERPGAAPSYNHAWFCWSSAHRGPPTICYAP